MSVSERGRKFDLRRAETLALLSLAAQAACAAAVAGVAYGVSSAAAWLLLPQAAIAAAVWLVTLLHLRLRRAAREETLDLEEAERQRRARGVQALFDETQQGQAARNLAQMDKYLAPFLGLVEAALLLAAPVLVAAKAQAVGFYQLDNVLPPLAVEKPLAVFLACVFPALALFLIGMYASGLSREKGAALLRAGAGNTVATAIFLAAAGLGLSLSKVGWVGAWADLGLAAAVCAWMTLQAAEILVNLVLDVYRPRLSGVETRPAYDSRLSGLLAEPQGLFRTFAQTLDYQFGFKVSDTWFFKFLEKALAPLLLIQALTLYLLTGLVVVEPGQAAIVERWGAPRGIAKLPPAEADWSGLAQPLGPGLHLKWPWPIETANVVDRERVNRMVVGFAAADESKSEQMATDLAAKIVTWDKEHVENETQYLMPLPEEMTGIAQGKNEPAPAVFLSGTFTIEYRVGDGAGDVYRAAYGYRDPRAALRALFEREVTAYLAGAHFWDMLAKKPIEARDLMLQRLRAAVARERLGLEIVTLGVHNLHPPVGKVGEEYQKVLGSRQELKKIEHEAEIDASQIKGTAPSEADRILTDAKIYRTGRISLAQAEAESFRNQLKAYAAAPAAYLERTKMFALEKALAGARKIVIPENVTVVLDSKKAFSADMMEIGKEVAGQKGGK